MKCIKAIKSTNHTNVGAIIRTTDIEADSKVKTGYWSYVPKSEWKLSKGKVKNVTEGENTEETKENKKKSKKVSK